MNLSKTQSFVLIALAILVLGLPLLAVAVFALPFLLVYFCWTKYLELRNVLNRRKLDFELVLEGKLDLKRKSKNVVDN
ncbi:hypothetical protein [Muricauda sp. MAR_2010_75]|uniref:hypothetical protein n=1 Tax=Allomuricauda sp. MAR_2010_75 TaxID=1250232 RepID=UPI0005656F44|nr:hypothetical protein [Muricauda sp. MAR_2010_75]